MNGSRGQCSPPGAVASWDRVPGSGSGSATPPLGLRVSSSSVLSLILDETSLHNGSGDDVPDLGIWKTLRVARDLLPGVAIDRHTPVDWVASHTIGLWYATQEREALHAGGHGHTPLLSNLMPWGACLPVPIYDWEAFVRQPIGAWLEWLPRSVAHPYRSLLFYTIDVPEPDERLSGDDTRDGADVPVYDINLYFPVELADIQGQPAARLPDAAFFQQFAGRGNQRVLCNSRADRPTLEAWNVMYAGEVIELGMHFRPEALCALDADPVRMRRFGSAYVRALADLMAADREGAIPASFRACVERDYWALRRGMDPAEFRAADAMMRLVTLFAVLLLPPGGGGAAARRLEAALVRMVRSEFELGWPTETAVLDLLNCHGLDTGRVPRAYIVGDAAGAAAPASSSSSVA